MRPSFHPRLVNGPFGDPGVFVPLCFENRALMMDLGDTANLSPRDLLKISHIFVTHAHMDHFIGFDRILRLMLGREKTLYLYGPEGFISHVEGKLTGYSWNLVSNYTNQFTLVVSEISSNTIVVKEYECQKGFTSESTGNRTSFNGIVHQEAGFSISAVILDHRIPSLGFSIQERFHINILKERVMELGLTVGPWLNTFKQAVFKNQDPNSEFVVPDRFTGTGDRRFPLTDLINRIAMITPGQKISYIADCVFSKSNAKLAIELARGSDQLFIESAFLDADRQMAREKYHLTAKQAGFIAGKSGVKQFVLFHFSPRYMGMEDQFHIEAQNAYQTHFTPLPPESDLALGAISS